MLAKRALDELHRSPDSAQCALPLSTRSVDVSKMIQKKKNNKVVGLLQSEQVDDDDKKTSCVPRFTLTE